MTPDPQQPSTTPSPSPSRSSLRALDGLNFFLADVRDGMGPFLGTFLRDRQHWDAGWVGFALGATQVGTVLAQTPAGALVDRTRHKRILMSLAAAVVAAGCVLLYLAPTAAVVLGAQAVIGAAAAVFPPAIAALTLGIVGRAALARRTGRNEAFNHGGNVAAALLAGGAAKYLGYGAMFGLVAAMAALSIGATWMIREADIDHDLARGADDADADAGDATPAVAGLGALFRDRRVLAFVVAAVLFHLGNAAMLPLVGQKASDRLKEDAPLLMSACIVAAQVVMVPVALLASRLAESWGRKPVFLIGFAVLPVRGVLYCFGTNPAYLVAVQLLDGIGAGIFGVVSVLVVADLTRGTGRFNFAQGVLATATGLGAGASNVLAGLVVARAGFNAGFLALAATALAGVAFFALAMPETRDAAAGTTPRRPDVAPASPIA